MGNGTNDGNQFFAKHILDIKSPPQVIHRTSQHNDKTTITINKRLMLQQNLTVLFTSDIECISMHYTLLNVST